MIKVDMTYYPLEDVLSIVLNNEETEVETFIYECYDDDAERVYLRYKALFSTNNIDYKVID